MKLRELRAKRAELIAEARALVDAAKGEDRDLTAEEQAGVDAKLGEADKYAAKIQQLEKLEAAEASLTAPAPRVGQPIQPGSTGEPARVFAVPAGKAPKGFTSNEQAYRAGQWAMATLFGSQRARQWCQDYGGPSIGAVMSTTANTAGGYLVPDEFASAIIDLREVYGVFRQHARVWPMKSDVTIIPRRTGGVTAYFVSENSEITVSDKSWDAVQLTARKLAALCKYSMELDEDAVVQLAGDLAQEIGYAFAVKEDQCGFVGDGTSTYGGIQGITVKIGSAGVCDAASTHTGFATLTLTDYHNTVAKLPVYALPNAKWFISQAGFAASMQQLMYAAGGNTVDNVTGAPRLSFLGYPVVISQVLNSTLGADASKIKVLFGDLRLSSTMGERRGITLMTSTERYFEFDQIGIKGCERIDIVNHDVGDSSTAGPVVALKSAAS